MNFLLIGLLAAKIYAAPHPLTGSSVINSPASGFAFGSMGFSLDSVPENWIFKKSVDGNGSGVEIGLKEKTLLSFREETVSPKTQLESFVRGYLRDYNQYGFEVIGLQSQIKAAVPSVTVDLRQKTKDIRSRQVFFHNSDKIVIATCADENLRFDATLATCNRILGSFRWR